LEDLVQSGIIGLFDAAGKFDPARQDVFSHYAKHRIKGAILDSLRQLDWASRDTRRAHKQVETAKSDLMKTLERPPTEAEVAEKLGIHVDRLRTLMLGAENMGPISSDARSNAYEDLPAPDSPGKRETEPDSICVRKELRNTLDVAVHTLSARYQTMFRMYYQEELTMKEIGRALGINESRVSQIHKAGLEKMATALRRSGIDSIHAFQA
jgi:RNA polymerase sigma factor for flagellar operon FliA